MKKSILIMSAGLVGLALASFTFLTPLAGNLAVNSGFESGTAPWTVGWGFEIDKEVKHSGDASCKITAKADAWRGSQQFIKLPAGTQSIKVKGWLKTEDIKPNDGAWNNARISVSFRKEDKTTKVGPENPPVVGEASETTDWKEYSSLYMIPEECVYVELLVTCGTATGTAWYDDLSFQIIE